MALAGIFQILHTPFTDDGTIDWQSFANQIDYCMAAKVHGWCFRRWRANSSR